MRITELPRKLRRFGALNLADQWLLLRAAAHLALARIQLARTPFDRLAARLSEAAGQDTSIPDPELVSRVQYAVSSAAGNVPWRSDCFPQAIAAFKLLQRQGYSSSIHLGVEKPGDELLGHAWLTCGDTVVTGGEEVDRYVEIHRLGE